MRERARERASPMNGQTYFFPKCPARGQAFFCWFIITKAQKQLKNQHALKLMANFSFAVINPKLKVQSLFTGLHAVPELSALVF